MKELSVALALGMLASSAALAQSNAGGGPPAASVDAGSNHIEEIVVTAQRRSENLQNVPVAVTAATSARLASIGITSAGDLSLITPSLSLPQAAGTLQPHIRGVGTQSSGPGVENPVALYVDGVYFASGTASLLTLNNIDRVEVLKGPQGTLFGRNATGGLIQVITKTPSYTPSVAMNVGYANYNDVTWDSYATGGLSDHIAADIALRYEHQGDGWGHNLYNGNPVNQLQHDFAARSKILFDLGGSTKATLALDYINRAGSTDAQHTIPGAPLTFNNAVFGGPFPQGEPYDVNKNVNEVSRLKAGGASLTINHDFGKVAFQSITAYRQTRFAFSLDLDETPKSLIACCGPSRSDQYSQEFQLSSIGNGKFKWVTGAFLFYATDGFHPINIFLNGQASPIPGGTPFIISDDNRQRTRSAAGYAQGSYEVLDGTTLTVGGRITYEDKHLSGSESILVGGAVTSQTPIPNPAMGIPNNISFTRFNYRLALDHKFGPDVLGYISHNTGFKSGGYNLLSSTNPPYKPENITAEEVGLKTQLFDRRLRFNIAAYYYDYSNLQVAVYTGGTQTTTNGAKARIYGTDFDANAVLGGGFSLNGGLGYVHGRFTSYPFASFYSGAGGCALPQGSFCSQSAQGKHLPNTPDLTFNIGADYRTPLAGGTMAASVNFSHSDRWYAAPDNFESQAPYSLLNASIAFTDQIKGVSLRFWGKNLTNRLYATGIFEANQGIDRQLGAPRTYGATLGYKF